MNSLQQLAMKKTIFTIKSCSESAEDDFEHGVSVEICNTWSNNSKTLILDSISVENEVFDKLYNFLQNYIDNELFFTFTDKNIFINEEGDLIFSHLVDNDNIEASE